MVFKIGYAKPYNTLKENMKLLQGGSKGKITNMIVSKLEHAEESRDKNSSQVCEDVGFEREAYKNR